MEAELNVATLVTFVLYLVVMLLFGLLAYRVTNNLSDYILGGRRLGPGVTALSAGASDMSGWLLLGLPGAVYAAGMNQIWIAVGLAVGALLNWLFVARRLRRHTVIADDAITLPDFLERRFEDDTRILRVASAVVILVFFTFYTSSGMVAGATLFENTFGLDYNTALFVGAAVIIVYTFLGGFLAVSWTDFLQGILMFCALLLVPAVGIVSFGGWGEVSSTVAGIDPGRLSVWHEMTFLSVVSLLAWGLGYFGQPHILARFMAIRNEDEMPRAMGVGMTWMVLSLIGAIFTGMVAMAWFADSPLDDQEAAFIMMNQVLFNPWVAGILLAAILAAIMSTIDSQLLVSSSALTADFYRALIREDASDRELVWVGRAAVLGVAIIATLLAMDDDSLVLDLVAYAWAGFGAAFGPVIILSLFWKEMTRNGALAGLIVGAVTVIVWEGLSGGPGGIFDVYEILPGFILAALAVWVFSVTGPRPSAALRVQFERAHE
ncbi:sodium/proline symporter PutP [Aquisalimonas lutea]|uniref:sodium/proline symporter PutP n=1 Tax=Aquisalimonas lutea TaxID=1327750 RepID=UPI0025B47219|nr:sodium/proline symporter PutP [Aquisalimonas lutea]MDN3516985.1 sodium/proline symporter PutP [Aquisalimonas lutea]